MSADQQPPRDAPQPTGGPNSASLSRRVDIVALVAGVVFILFSAVSLTVGVLDLPDIGAAPLWLLLIGAGVLLLISELRARKNNSSGSAPSSDSPELSAWEQDTYR